MPTPKKTNSTSSSADTSPDGLAAVTDLDLDALERDGEAQEPFRVRLAGDLFEFPAPADMDWKDLLGSLSNPATFFQSLPPEQREKFIKIKIPLWKMEELVSRYAKHFGMPSKGEANALS